MLFSIGNDPVIFSNELNHYLEVINHWAFQWKMEFNPDPRTQPTELLFSYHHLTENVVPKVNEQKELSFESYSNEKIIIAKICIGIIKYLSKFLPLKALD